MKAESPVQRVRFYIHYIHWGRKKQCMNLKQGMRQERGFLIRKLAHGRKPAPGNQANWALPGWEGNPINIPHAMVVK
jgi:hypothetical protein